MKVVIATGASGGHVFPGLTVGQALRAQGHTVVFAGAFLEWQGLIQDEGFPYIDLPAKAFKAESLKSILVSVVFMIKSFHLSRVFLKKEAPAVVLGFGGYGSFPVVLAAACQRIPAVIHEQNVIPGRANCWLALFVKKIALSFDQTRKYFSQKKVVVTGYPVRRFPAESSRRQSRKELNLDEDAWTIAVIGGSQGSRTLNTVMVQTADLLKQKTRDVQIVHITGPAECDLVRLSYDRAGIRHAVFPFYREIHRIYCAADIIVTRAGAGAVHEMMHFGIPGILVPYPYAGGHQRQNALAVAGRGKGIMIEEKQLTAQRIFAELMQFRDSGRAFSARNPDASEHKDATQNMICLLEEIAAS